MPGTTHSRGQVNVVNVHCYVAAMYSAKTNTAMILTFLLLLSIHKNKDKGEGHNSGLEKFWYVRLKK